LASPTSGHQQGVNVAPGEVFELPNSPAKTAAKPVTPKPSDNSPTQAVNSTQQPVQANPWPFYLPEAPAKESAAAAGADKPDSQAATTPSQPGQVGLAMAEPWPYHGPSAAGASATASLPHSQAQTPSAPEVVNPTTVPISGPQAGVIIVDSTPQPVHVEDPGPLQTNPQVYPAVTMPVQTVSTQPVPSTTSAAVAQAPIQHAMQSHNLQGAVPSPAHSPSPESAVSPISSPPMPSHSLAGGFVPYRPVTGRPSVSGTPPLANTQQAPYPAPTSTSPPVSPRPPAQNDPFPQPQYIQHNAGARPPTSPPPAMPSPHQTVSQINPAVLPQQPQYAPAVPNPQYNAVPAVPPSQASNPNPPQQSYFPQQPTYATNAPPTQPYSPNFVSPSVTHATTMPSQPSPQSTPVVSPAGQALLHAATEPSHPSSPPPPYSSVVPAPRPDIVSPQFPHNGPGYGGPMGKPALPVFQQTHMLPMPAPFQMNSPPPGPHFYAGKPPELPPRPLTAVGVPQQGPVYHPGYPNPPMNFPPPPPTPSTGAHPPTRFDSRLISMATAKKLLTKTNEYLENAVAPIVSNLQHQHPNAGFRPQNYRPGMPPQQPYYAQPGGQATMPGPASQLPYHQGEA
jgi:hypothetical protein